MSTNRSSDAPLPGARAAAASPASSVQLFALGARGPEPIAARAQAGSVHELLDEAPLGVYSALRTFHHDRFLELEAHLERTDRSMERLGWDFRLDRLALRRALHEIVSAYPEADARVRFDVLATPAPSLGTEERVLIALSPFKPVSERYLREGVKVELAPELARERPLIKTADFVLRRRPYPLERQDAYEHLMLDREGRILEGTSSNFYGVRAGAILTIGPGVLEGVTRRIVARLAADLGLRFAFEPIRASELGALDEAFMSSSIRGIVPIVGVAGTTIGSGVPGPHVPRLIDAYYALAEREARTAV